MMINWAAEDVANLFVLQSKQVASVKNEGRCKAASEEGLAIRDKVHALVVVENVGRFIGRNGSSINSLLRSLKPQGAEFQRINPEFGKRENFVIYADDEKALEIVKTRVRQAGANYSLFQQLL